MNLLRPWGRSHGSGFVWDASGHIVTNFHVVRGASLLAVQFSGDKECRARLVGGSPDCDLAVLLVAQGCFTHPSQLPPPLPLERRTPSPGERVAAIGHPGHWSLLVGEGVVSGVGRKGSRLLSHMQTAGGLSTFQRHCAADGIVLTTAAAAGPGSSGGPLLSAAGRVAGVTTWQFGGLSQPHVMVAISVDVLHKVIPDLIQKGEYHVPQVGVERSLGRARLAWPRRHANALLGVRAEGVRIWGPPGAEARRAGLRCFDEVLSLGGSKVRHPADCLDVVQRTRPGSNLSVRFRRPLDPPGQERQAQVLVGTLKTHKWRRRARQLLRAGLRVYVAARVARSAVKSSQDATEDASAIMRGLGVLLTNKTSLPKKPLPLLKHVIQFALSPPDNICSAFMKGKVCRRDPGARSFSWKNVKNSAACRKKCERRSTDGSTSCCTFESGGRACHLYPSPNATDPFDVGKTANSSGTSAVCHAFHPDVVLSRVLRVWGLLSGIVTD